MNFNRLEMLPEDLGNAAPALMQLYAVGNQLTSLPATLGTVPLVDCFLSENK